MKNLEYYEKQAKRIYLKELKRRLKSGSVPLSVDLTVNNTKELERPAVRATMKRLWKKRAAAMMDKDMEFKLMLVYPSKSSKLNGIELEEGICLPIYTAPIMDEIDYRSDMIAVGLFMMLRKEKDEYYLKLLRSFKFDKPTEEVERMLSGEFWD